MIIGLEFLHLNGVIHRDVRPSNFVFDEQGFLKTIDLGLARIWQPNNAADTSGSPGYMAPEVIMRQNHSFTSDFFGIGVITHELMLGRRPYVGNDRISFKEQLTRE